MSDVSVPEYGISASSQKLKETDTKESENFPRHNFFFIEDTPPEIQNWMEHLANEVFTDMGKYLPSDVMPTASTILAIRDDDYHNGEYLGSLNDEHYIRISAPLTQLSNKKDRIAIQVSLAHELLHQRTFELVRYKDVMKYDPKEGLAEAVYPLETRRHIIKFISDYNQIRHPMNTPLPYILIEGIAVIGELYLLNQWIEEAKRENKEDLPFLLDEKWERLNYLRGEGHYTNNNWENTYEGRKCYDPYFLGVMKVMKPMVDQFGLDKVPDLLKSIDFKRCRQIKDIDAVKYILEDPRRIPGLEKLPEPHTSPIVNSI